MGRCMSRMSGGVRMREYKFRAWNWELVEVIGNIYENPELLESGE